jgi:glutaredoxin
MLTLADQLKNFYLWGATVQKLLLMLLVCCGMVLFFAVASAEIYKSVDDEGKVRFTDVQPAGVASEQLDLQPINSAGGGKLKSAAKSSSATAASVAPTNKYPKVELFVTGWCGYCKKAEAYLRVRGIPFTVYDIEKDLEAARRKNSLASRKGVPFALIGDQKLTGFSKAYYDRAFQKAQ